MCRSFNETLGWLTGYVIGLLTWIISWLRSARTFHPQGILYEAEVINLFPEKLRFHEHALVRVSGTLWKKMESPDILGVAIRFTPQRRTGVLTSEEDQDLLFATFRNLLSAPLAIFATHAKDFLQDEYYSVLPYSAVNWEECYFRLIPSHDEEDGTDRGEKLHRALDKRKAWYLLQVQVGGGEWLALARINLIRQSPLDQEEIAFNPFNRGLGITPRGFLQHLRLGAYRLSASGRQRSRRRFLVTATGRR